MVLACDGIWNFMSSQDVCDYIHERLNCTNYSKLSQICEELFMHCLAPNTYGDGTGCDNMTCIIVTFDPFRKYEFNTKFNNHLPITIKNGNGDEEKTNGGLKRTFDQPAKTTIITDDEKMSVVYKKMKQDDATS